MGDGLAIQPMAVSASAMGILASGPDAGLMLAVRQSTNGANVHAAMNVLQSYVYACELGDLKAIAKYTSECNRLAYGSRKGVN